MAVFRHRPQDAPPSTSQTASQTARPTAPHPASPPRNAAQARSRLLLRQVLRFVAAHGPVEALRLAVGRLTSSIAGSAPLLDPYPTDAPVAIHPFDVVHGVNTSGLHRAEDLAANRAGDTFGPALWNTAFYAISPSIFERVVYPLSLDWPSFTFVDLGCGKGRALLLASLLPFRHILGVELDPGLAELARRNLQTFCPPTRLCHSVEVVETDAATVSIPETPLVVFLYNPFLAPTLRRVLRSLERSLHRHPRELWLIYINPEAIRVLKHFPFLRQHAHTTLVVAPEDALADRFGTTEEEVSIYHAHPRDL